METEYGFAVRARDPKRSLRDREWVQRFFGIVEEQLPHLSSMEGNGIFLQNGARFYLDCSHPEMTTPECANPWDIVRYMHAGERILCAGANEMVKRDRALGEVLVFKTNVDHSGSGSTWGCHASFLHRSEPRKLPQEMIPHLVSRIIYSGAGGIELSTDGRLLFTISPRVKFLECEVSHNSTGERGIFHTKDETLSANGYHRLHIICGESTCSETALWLNMGATALIVAMIEAGLQPGSAVRLAKPLEAMRQFATDPTCTAVALTTDKRNLSAIEIQRHYLKMAETHCHASFMPPWAEQVCVRWRAMLDRLETGAPASVTAVLDWGIKFSLFINRAQQRGISADRWFHSSSPNGHDVPWFIPSEGSKVPEAATLGAIKVYQELCEIDTRFGQLGGRGIFGALDGRGVLRHQIPGVDNIEHAMANGPAIGRARMRAECVKRYAGHKKRYACGWAHVVDQEKHLLFDISDPFTSEETWRPVPPGFPDPYVRIPSYAHNALEQARECHDRGDNETAARLLQTISDQQSRLDPNLRALFLRLRAWIQSRRGFIDSIGALDEMTESQPLNLSIINSYVYAYRFQGLMPAPAIEEWIQRGRHFLSPAPDPSDSAALPFLGHWGYYLLRIGRAEDASRTLTDACDPIRRDCAYPPALVRALADWGDACRALGQSSDARILLDEAETVQQESVCEGDRVDFILTYRAKLEKNPTRALGLIREAKAHQITLGNIMGEARSLLLEARLLCDSVAAVSLKIRLEELGRQRPALAQCRMFGKIMDHWDSWTRGDSDPAGGQDRFWWL